MLNLLFVCTGNTCRSPLAAAEALRLMRRSDLDFSDVSVASAGIAANAEAAASEGSLLVGQTHGLDLSAHRAQQLTPEILATADYCYAMTAAQVQLLAARFPHAAERILTLAETDITDPFGGPQAAYEQAYQDILAALNDKYRLWSKEERG